MQTSYPTEPVAGKLGQLSDAGDHDIVSRFSAAIIPFGRAVSYGGAESKVKLPAAATDVQTAGDFGMFEGIALEDPSKECTAENTLGVAGINAAIHEIGDAIPVLKRGRCFVYTEQAVAPSDPVFVRFTASGNNVVGNFRKDLDTDKAVAAGEKIHFVGVTSGAGLVEVDIRL
jgi:hypothetical protein